MSINVPANYINNFAVSLLGHDSQEFKPYSIFQFDLNSMVNHIDIASINSHFIPV